MRIMPTVALVLIALQASGRPSVGEDTTTWADSHPELAQIFGHPFTQQGREHRAKTFVPWTAEVYEPNIAASQPSIVLGKNGELIANAWNFPVHSIDAGRTWEQLGSPALIRQAPEGYKHLKTTYDGCGITEKGTILLHYDVQYNDGRKPAGGYDDSSFHADQYVVRSTDHGKTWGPHVKLNSTPLELTGSQRCRIAQLPGGVLALPMAAWNRPEPGKSLPQSEWYARTYMYTSSDDGQTWQRQEKPICLHGWEPDLLVLPSGRILVAVRYQRTKLPDDPPELASPHTMLKDSAPYTKSKEIGGGLVARNTAVLHSDDGGKTWSKPRLVTGFDEQTGCLIRLSDGTVILPFGHKTDGSGQRFMLSYDEGETWSRTVYDFPTDGMYASSVVLDDQTIVTVYHRIVDQAGTFRAFRWRAPSRETVAKGGFWKPRVVEPLGRPVRRTDKTPAEWEDGRQCSVDGLRLSLSQPVLVARSKGYLWFPTLARLSNGDLLAVMSDYPDEHVQTATASVALSKDGGLTWSEAVDARYGDVSVTLPNGDELLLPYHLRPISDGTMGAPYQICAPGTRQLDLIQDGVQVSGWPRPDRSFAPELGLSGFVFNGQSARLKDGNYLTMLYGNFKDARRYNLLAAESPDGVQWKILATIADENCDLPGANGPCESAVCRLADGRLMCVFRMESNVPYGQSFSSDEGKTWSKPVAMKSAFSVEPSLAVMKDGMVALSGGRPGLFLWVNTDGTGKDWQQMDVLANHNEFRADEPILEPGKTSSYTEIVALDDTHLLYIYDRIPNGWAPIPTDSADTNSVWVVRVTIEKTR